jgi:hypothetical protein
MNWLGISLLVILFLFEAIALLSAIVHLINKTKSDSDERNNAWGVLVLVVLIITFSIFSTVYFYQSVGVPQRGDSNFSPFDPFDNGKIFKKVWESKRGSDTLFSVVNFSLWHNGVNSWVKKDTLPEVLFTRKQVVPDSVFVVLHNKFVPITYEQAYKILKMEISEKQIDEFLKSFVK